MTILSPALTEKLRRQALQEKQRRKLIDFTCAFTNEYDPGWVHLDIAAHLEAFIEAVERKKSPRLMIFLPPRTGKSQLVSRCFPAFCLGHHPEWEIILATYGQELADDLGRYVRSILNDAEFNRIFPGTIVDRGSNAADRIDTTARGGFRSVGRGGSLTGRGCRILLIDDPLKDDSEADSATIQNNLRSWYQTSARTRLAPGGGVIIVQTLWSLNDLPLILLENAKDHKDVDQWCVYKYPAIATQDEPHRKKGEALHPSRFPIEDLLKTRAAFMADGKARWWNALYQQTPVADEGNFFKRDWFQRYDKIPDKVTWYLGVDYATSKSNQSDHTAIIPFAIDANHNIYIGQDIVHGHLTSLEAVNEVLRVGKSHKVYQVASEAGVIENVLGPLMNIRMAEERYYPFIWTLRRAQGKHVYASALQGRMQQKKVFFPKNSAFVDEVLMPEFLAFLPSADNKHDNLIDALSNGMMMLDTLIAPRVDKVEAKEEAPKYSTYEEMHAPRSNATQHSKGNHRPISLFARPNRTKRHR